MALIDQETFRRYFRTPGYVAFLDGQPREPNHFLHVHRDRSFRCADAVALEVYSALSWVLEACPSVISIRPVWDARLGNPNTPTVTEVSFQIVLETQETGNVVKQSCKPGGQGYPESILRNAKGTSALDLALELGTGIDNRLWNSAVLLNLVQRIDPYTSVAQLEAGMHEDLETFLPEVRAWITEQALQTLIQVVPEPILGKPRM